MRRSRRSRTISPRRPTERAHCALGSVARQLRTPRRGSAAITTAGSRRFIGSSSRRGSVCSSSAAARRFARLARGRRSASGSISPPRRSRRHSAASQAAFCPRRCAGPALDEKFDFIILSDLVNDLWDVQQIFERLAAVCTPQTRIIINFYSRLWELPLALARKLGASRPAAASRTG